MYFRIEYGALIAALIFLGVGGGQQSSCEEHLLKCQQEEVELEHRLVDLTSQVDQLDQQNADLLGNIANLTDEAIKLRVLISELEQSNTELRIEIARLKHNHVFGAFDFIGTGCIVLVSLAFLWWLVPHVIRFTLFVRGSVSSFVIATWRLIPSMASNRQAAAGNYEEFDLPYRDEATIAGSCIQTLKPGSYASSVFKIFKRDEYMANQLTFVGLGFWADVGDKILKKGVFITAGHNIMGDVVLKNANDPTRVVEVKHETWQSLEGYDVVYFIPDQPTTTKLGVTKAKCPANRLRTREAVMVFGRDVRTQGMLSSMEDSVYVSYMGTSVGGFSGSPYIAGNYAYGVHVGSTQEQGIGLDMGFVNMKLRALARMKEESSSDWLTNELIRATKGKKKIAYKEFGMDDVIVDVGGKEIFMDRGEFNDLYDRFNDTLKEVKKFPSPSYDFETYDDSETLPKNVQGPRVSGPNPIPAKVQEKLIAPVLEIGEQNVTVAQVHNHPKLRKLSSSGGIMEPSTVGPPSTPVLSSAALQSMLESLSKRMDQQSSRSIKIEKMLVQLSQPSPKKPGATKSSPNSPTGST
uniref:Orf1 n=2 Tax=Motts Mill virus TaxID=1654359 RepID=A0A2Z4QL02_9VIRU|nr:orf1 [Motts Mill virus]